MNHPTQSYRLVILMSISLSWSINAFSISPSCITGSNQFTQKLQSWSKSKIYGLLDDVMEAASTESTASSSTSTSNNDNQQYEDLFMSLIMSADTQGDIVNSLDQCSDSNFINYLNVCIEHSSDEEESQGLRDLIALIQQVKTRVMTERQILEEEKRKKEAFKLQKGEELGNNDTKSSMSNADVIKEAFAIDQAGSTSATDDSEKSSDFISDCREVVNLSRGFNNQGQMRVGGR